MLTWRPEPPTRHARVEHDESRGWYALRDDSASERYGLRDDGASELHRDGGPAVEYPDGGKSWWRRGLRHRVGGPAIEWSDGSREWWFEGRFVRRERGPGTAANAELPLWGDPSDRGPSLFLVEGTP